MSLGWRRWRVAAAALTVLCSVAACTAAQETPAPTAREEQASAAPVPTKAPPNYRAMEQELERRITDRRTGLQAVRAVLVSVDGKTVIAHYRASRSSEHAHVFSVTKSVMSILVGIALDQGYLKSLDQTLGESLPKYRSQMTDQVAAITLRQLLTHTSGIPGNGMGSSGAFALAADDAVGLILTYGLLNDPGTVFDYSNSGSHLVGAVLAEATGRPVLDYAREQLFNPLGIKTRPAYEGFDAGEPTSQFEKDGFAWAADRQGIHTGCCWLKLTTPDMLKIGELYLNEGSWKGQRIVSAAWVRDSTTSQVTAEQLGPAGGYGYFWWLDQLRGHRSYAAVGSFGQLMAVVPDLKLVVAVSSRPDGYADEADVGPILDGIVSGLE
ncbi:MAG: hypothetical protein QOF52_3500 [Propionibacteriaceae bacterium]|jgi:CubicO group peptidase (beta-lactamase class C family)|nr:hypothetical protein [Propionibacteriaceae bacterium]